MKIPVHRLLFRPLLGIRSGDYPKGMHGMQEGRTIVLDPRTPMLGPTYVHEILHLKHPSWSETRVQQEERRVWRKLSWKAKAQLLQQLGKGRIA